MTFFTLIITVILRIYIRKRYAT